MDAATTIVGLLAAGSQIYSTLERIISIFPDPPPVARTAWDEVRHFLYILTQLQPRVAGSVPINLLGASMINVDHLSLILAALVVIFSKLEKYLDCHVFRDRTTDRLVAQGRVGKSDDGLVARAMDAISQWRWLRDHGELVRLVGHIRHHKSSLNSLLTVLMWYVLAFDSAFSSFILTRFLLAKPQPRQSRPESVSRPRWLKQSVA